MPAHPVRTFDEVAEMMRNAPPPTADDVWIASDGRRLDTAEKVIAHVHAINEEITRDKRVRQEDGPAA